MTNTAIPNPAQTLTHAQYPAYKDSGVDWLGEIPAHWKVVRLKRICEFKYGWSLQSEKRDDTGLVKVFGSNGVVGYHSQSITKAPAIIIGRKGSFGKINYSEEACFPIDTTYYIDGTVTANKLRYVYYLLQTLGLDTFSQDSAVPGLSREEAYNKICFLPPLAEQIRIAEFLDRKTAQIDQAIAQKERLIELLNERRQVMIHKAVTRGLNPDAPMKDSGIDRGDARWIGEIPAHWEVNRINWLFTEKDETGYPSLPLLIVSINSGVTVRDMDDNENRKQLAEDFNVYKRALARDIAFNKMRMWQGAVGVVPQDGLVSPDYVVARPNEFINSAYYGFLFKTRDYLAEFVKHSHGIAWDRNRLYWEDFKSIFALVPPLKEQNQIVEFLNTQQREIAFATRIVEHQIQKLQELKSTLINSAVTGKIKV